MPKETRISMSQGFIGGVSFDSRGRCFPPYIAVQTGFRALGEDFMNQVRPRTQVCLWSPLRLPPLPDRVRLETGPYSVEARTRGS